MYTTPTISLSGAKVSSRSLTVALATLLAMAVACCPATALPETITVLGSSAPVRVVTRRA